MCHISNFSLFLLGSLTMTHGDRHQNSVSNWLRSKDISHNIILHLSLVAILFLTSKFFSSRMASWHPPDSDSGMVQDDESTIKVHNNAKTRFSWIWPFGIWTIYIVAMLLEPVTLCYVNRDRRATRTGDAVLCEP